MTRESEGIDVALVAALGVAMVVSGRARGAEPPFQLSRQHDSVFRLEAFTSTDYFHFGKDGKYREIAREHMFTEELDHGTWKQDATGQIELQSAVLLKELKSGPLRIPVRDVEQFAALRPLEKDVAAFLVANKKDTFTRNEIEGAWNYTYTWSLFESKITFSAVEVERTTKKVTRKQIGDLLKAWGAYLKSDAKNRFHFVPVEYHKFVLLASNDYPFMANADSPQKVTETADLFGRPKGEPAMVYVLTDSDAALKEMKTTHPFLFHPEMNQGRSGERAKDK